MSDGAGALSALSSDLAFSVSFSIASELLDAGKESGTSEEELIALVLVLSVLAAAIPRSSKLLVSELRTRGLVRELDPNPSSNLNGLISFASLLISIVHRIAVSTSVQLLASNGQALLIWRGAFLVLELGLCVADGATSLDIQRDGLASQRLHDVLRSPAQTVIEGGVTINTS